MEDTLRNPLIHLAETKGLHTMFVLLSGAGTADARPESASSIPDVFTLVTAMPALGWTAMALVFFSATLWYLTTRRAENSES
jgi:hypothetical protein